MNAVGINTSKGKSMVAVLRLLGVTAAKPFEVSHTATELGKLADFLKSMDGETQVIMEHTGLYYEPVARVLHDHKLFVSAVNPLLIRAYGGNSLRRVKTDRADARKIARYGLDNWVELRQYTPMDTIRYELKTLNRQFQLASKNGTAAVNILTALLDMAYLGIRELFTNHVRPDGTQKWVDCVRTVSLNTFAERYQKWCKRWHYQFNRQKAEAIHTAAREQIALISKTT